MTQKTVTIYTTPTCHFCHMAKDFFEEENVSFEEVDVSKSREKAMEMIELSGQQGVPVISIGDAVIVGFDEEQIRQELNLK